MQILLNNAPDTTPLDAADVLPSKPPPPSPSGLIRLPRSNLQRRRSKSSSNTAPVAAGGLVGLGRGSVPFRSTAAALCYLTTDSTMKPLELQAHIQPSQLRFYLCQLEARGLFTKRLMTHGTVHSGSPLECETHLIWLAGALIYSCLLPLCLRRRGGGGWMNVVLIVQQILTDSIEHLDFMSRACSLFYGGSRAPISDVTLSCFDF